MRKSPVLIQHLTISMTVLLVMLGIVFSFFLIADDMLINPSKYLLQDVDAAVFQSAAVHISLIIVSVLISYIIYLLLGARTRTEIAVMNAIASLALSLEQLDKLYDGAPVPYLILDEEGDITEANKAAVRFFGSIQRQIQGRNLFSDYITEDKEKSEKLSHYYRSNVPINNEEVQIATKDGILRWVILTVFEVKSPKTLKRTGLCTIFDITDQKELDKAKTEFVSLASHQLRAPTTAIKWYMETLLSGGAGSLSHKQEDYVSRIYKVNEDMISLVDTLLNVSRAEIGSLAIYSKPSDAEEIAESVLEELSSHISKKKIKVAKEFHGLRSVKTDPRLLRIVIHNLVSNAVKYTPEGGRISIVFKDSILERSISISDTGIGIPESEKDRIFTKMFRADNARSVDSQGTGLGLYLVKSIMEKMGGGIDFESEEGRGSTFTIKL